MPDQLGLDTSDLRKVSVVVVLMILVLTALVEGPPLVRLIVATTIALVSGVVFLGVTAVLNRYKPGL